MNKDELLRLRLRNQFLSVPCQGFWELAKNLCGLQAQYFNNVLYSIIIRCGSEALTGWEEKLIKTWTIRGTLHAIPECDLPIYTALTKDSAYITKYGIDMCLLKDVAAEIMALLGRGACGRQELKAYFRDKVKDEELLDRLFSGWGGIFTLLAAQGKIVFDRVTSRDFRVIPYKAPLDRFEALKILVARYFQYYGPATIADAGKLLGVKQAEIREVLKGLSNISDVSVDNKTLYYFKCSSPVPEIPKIIYLTGFDPMLLGYKDHGGILAEKHKRNIITATGVIKSALMIEGRIGGRWSIKGNKMQIALFEEAPKKLRCELLEAAERNFGGVIPELRITIA